MGLNDTMTKLMNAVRVKYALTDKLGINDATERISKDSQEAARVISTGPFCWGNNISSASTDSDGSMRFEATADSTSPFIGAYLYNVLKIPGIVQGNRYELSLLVKGNLVIKLAGNEHSPQYRQNQLNPQSWRRLNINFVADDGNILIYGTGKKGDWMTISDPCLSELGGVVNLVLTATFERRCAA